MARLDRLDRLYDYVIIAARTAKATFDGARFTASTLPGGVVDSVAGSAGGRRIALALLIPIGRVVRIVTPSTGSLKKMAPSRRARHRRPIRVVTQSAGGRFVGRFAAFRPVVGNAGRAVRSRSRIAGSHFLDTSTISTRPYIAILGYPFL